jgi:diguanylate cyclase (GGDEF)-like protein
VVSPARANRHALHAQGKDATTEHSPEGHQSSGLTSRLILAYVEREGGRPAVDALLERVGLADHEEQLRDENFWFDFATKIRLFEAAAEVLDDPDAALHIGAAALQLNVAPGVKLALRAFGTPQLVYTNIVRASGKFTWAHTWDVIDKGPGEVQLRYTDVSGVGYHRADCQYNRGLLSCVPEMFGMTPAEIEHDHCAVEGGDACVYDISWESSAGWKVPVAVVGTIAAAVVLPAALLAPALVPAAVAIPAIAASALSYRHHSKLRRRARNLKLQLDEQHQSANRLSASLRDLVSELRIEEVLDKITANAKAAVGGKEFALLVSDEPGRCHATSSGLPRDLLHALEQWAERTPRVFKAPLTVDELSTIDSLAQLAHDKRMPVGSLCAAPLFFKGETLGAVVALGHGPRAFLPHDSVVIQSYAAQAASALSNARLVERLERLARQDPLTELMNHREFHEAVEREVARSDRDGHIFSVLLLDLDGFKLVNDESGHAEGDKVLCKVARAIVEASRATDIACRIGGDEFGLVLPGSGADEAAMVGKRIAKLLRSMGVPVGVSYGVGQFPNDGPDKELLLLHADMALLSRKSEPAGGRRAESL